MLTVSHDILVGNALNCKKRKWKDLASITMGVAGIDVKGRTKTQSFKKTVYICFQKYVNLIKHFNTIAHDHIVLRAPKKL